jgi:hypothetical protein
VTVGLGFRAVKGGAASPEAKAAVAEGRKRQDQLAAAGSSKAFNLSAADIGSLLKRIGVAKPWRKEQKLIEQTA